MTAKIAQIGYVQIKPPKNKAAILIQLVHGEKGIKLFHRTSYILKCTGKM